MIKKRIGILLAFISLVLGLAGFAYYWTHRTIVLRLGLYSGSSWDVPNANEYSVINEVIAAFEEDYPNVKIEYESGIPKDKYADWLAEQIVKGQEPDVLMIPENDFNLLASTSALQDLTGYLLKDVDQSIFYESSLKAGVYNSHQYAMPFESNPVLMCINKELLEKEGITIPESGWTLEEFYDICQKVTKDTNGDGVIDQFGVTSYSWQEAVAAYGIQLFNEEGTKSYLNQGEVKEALSYWSRLNELSAGFHLTSDDFDQGKVAFLPMTLAQYRTYKPYPYHVAKFSSFEWTCIPMPSVDGELNASQIETSLFAISSKTKHSDLAWEFLKRLSTSEATQQDLVEHSQGSSVLKSVMLSQATKEWLKEDDFGANALTAETLDEILTDAQVQPKFKAYNSAMETMDYLISKALSENKIGTELANIQRQVEENLNQ